MPEDAGQVILALEVVDAIKIAFIINIGENITDNGLNPIITQACFLYLNWDIEGVFQGRRYRFAALLLP